jgi:hypothetical protein
MVAEILLLNIHQPAAAGMEERPKQWKRRRPKPRLVNSAGSGSATRPPTLQTISPREFAGRFAAAIREQQQSFTWFIGAGCSKSSGILDAAGLVEKWLLELHKLQSAPGENYET